MSLQIRYARVSVPAGVQPDTITARLGPSFTMSAEEGSVGMSEIVVDDTASTLTYVGLRRAYAYETTAPAHNQVVFNGYLQGRTVNRRAEGQDSDEPVTASDRRWTLTASDTNSLMSRRLITGSDGNRPAETDIARIQWLLDSNDKYLSNPHDSWTNPSPYIDTTGAVSMSAADVRGQTAFDVMNDCAQRSGKNWFARYYEANDTVPPTNGGSIALWYASPNGTSDTSTLRLTNVFADIDNIVTFAVLPDLQLSRDPTRSYSGIYLTYDGGTRYQQSTNVANLFQQRDAAVNNPNVKTAAEATALATRYLSDAATEEDRLVFRFVVAKQYVNLLREGQRFSGKFSHLSTDSAHDYGAWTWWRCLRRTVTQINDEFYEISGEASPIPCVPTVIRQGQLDSQPPVPDEGKFGIPFTPTAGKMLLAYLGYRLGSVWSTPIGWTLIDYRVATFELGQDTTGWVWKVSDGTEQFMDVGSTTNKEGYIFELDCATGAESFTSQWAQFGPSTAEPMVMTGLPVTAPGPGLVFGGFSINCDQRAGGNSPPVVPASGWTLEYQGQSVFYPMLTITSKAIQSAGSYTPSATKTHTVTEYTTVYYWAVWSLAVTGVS